jgi:hypothetical protein
MLGVELRKRKVRISSRDGEVEPVEPGDRQLQVAPGHLQIATCMLLNVHLRYSSPAHAI